MGRERQRETEERERGGDREIDGGERGTDNYAHSINAAA